MKNMNCYWKIIQRGKLRALKGGGGGVSIPFSSQIFLKIPVSIIRNPSVSDENINPIPICYCFRGLQIPVPVTEIPFSQPKIKQIPAPILPLHDPQSWRIWYSLQKQPPYLPCKAAALEAKVAFQLSDLAGPTNQFKWIARVLRTGSGQNGPAHGSE